MTNVIKLKYGIYVGACIARPWLIAMPLRTTNGRPYKMDFYNRFFLT